MNPGRPRLAAGLLALLAVTACNGNDDDEAQLELAVGAGEVRVLGDYENDLPLLIHDVSVGGDGLVYVQVRGGHVWRAGADDDLSPCCGASGIGDGGIAVAGDTVYIVHGDAADPPQRGVAAYAGETISAALDLPRDRGQLPGAVAVGPDASIYLTIARAEAGSTEGVQVLLATESGGFEVVAGQGVGCTHSRTSASEAQFTSLTGVAVAADGTVYVADPRCGSVYSIAAGQVDVVLGGPDDPHAAIRMPVDVAMVGDDVYVADAGTGEVVRVGDGETVLAADEVPEGFEPDELQSLAATPDGDLVVAVRHRLLGVGLG